MYDNHIQIRTRGKKRCAPACQLNVNGACIAGFMAGPGICGNNCPKDGDYVLVRADRAANEGGSVKSNIGGKDA